MNEIIYHSLIHSFEDTIKIMPFLLVVFIILEYLEHCLDNRHIKFIDKAKKSGPFWGSLLGAFPQCGFSIMATNLFASRMITAGTLTAIYLSTSDEMLPILISAKTDPLIIIMIIAIKIITGMIVGTFVDRFIRLNDDCKLYHSLKTCPKGSDKFKILPAIKRMLHISLIIFITGFFITLFTESFGEDLIRSALDTAPYLGPLVSGIVGIIPNCASSVVLTQLYISDIIPLGTAMAGLLSGSGVAWLVLFRQNRPLSYNILILMIVLGSGIIIGSLINLIL